MASTFQTKIINEYKSKGYTVIKVIKFSANGYPDLLCIKLNEPDIWIECKEFNDRLKPLQKRRIDELNKLGKKAFCIKDKKGIIYPIQTNNMAKSTIELPPDTKLKLIAIHKVTFEESYKTITYEEWVNFKKNRNYYYRVIQV